MNSFFLSILKREPVEVREGIAYFGNKEHGDCFDETDLALWQNGRFESNFESTAFIDNPVSNKLLAAITEAKSPVVELACGPGMGLMPSIKKLSSDCNCLATDASVLVMEGWSSYLAERADSPRIDFAQFSILDIPFKDDSVPCYTSFIGVSSTRGGYDGYDQVLKEIYRTLKPGGLFCTIESEWADIGAILTLFEKWGQTPWESIISANRQPSWRERFENCGFEVVSAEEFKYHKFTKDDNELGEAAEKYGIEIGTKLTAYILMK